MENQESESVEGIPQWDRKLLIGLLALVSIFFIYDSINNTTNSKTDKNRASSLSDINQLGAFEIQEPNLKYGFALDTFNVHYDTIQNNQFLADILLKHKIDFVAIDQIAKLTKDSFDVRSLRAGKPFVILNRDTATAADYFIYEPDVFRYVVYDLKNPGQVAIQHYPVETRLQVASGVIESSLWNAMTDNGYSFDLASKMEDVFGWSVDFHHIQKDDKFRLIYEQKMIDGHPVGVGMIRGAFFQNYENEYHGIYFENTKHSGFFDLEGRSMKKAFLKSPVKYSRISSGYNLNRFHPVLRRRKAHLGTDYAAPHGTPIFAVADGLVTKATRSGGSGNYVKIKHDEEIQTQYLHMSGFAKGIHSGVHVKQGQTIGYVGSTGLATGPHVCFRFWKHGKQVNHRRMNLPPPDPMPAADLPNYLALKDSIINELNKIPYPDGFKKELVNLNAVVDTVGSSGP